MVLETNHLDKIYGGKNEVTATHALEDMNIKVREGEFVGIMGPSGSGKTTLLNILAGLDIPTSGEVKIIGQAITKMNHNQLALFRRQHIGFVFQDFNLLDSLTAKENIMLPLILEKKAENEMENKVHNLLQYLEILPIENHYPYQLSGGQKQKVAIARALINEPAIIFADEPTGNLDSKSSHTIMRSLKKLNEEKKATILLVTHDPQAASFCNRIVFIQDGKKHIEMVKKSDQKTFFDEILDHQALLGGTK